MTAKVIQGSFLSGQPKLPPSSLRVPPPIQTKTLALPQSTAFAGRLPGSPARAFPARPPGPPAPAFGLGPGAVQRHGVGGAFAIEAGTLGLAAGGGRPLPEAVRGKMEAALGADFSTVRVHVGPQAERIGAVAFTLGTDIYFAPGRYQPETVGGQQLLGHELAHVVQQRAGRVRNPLGAGLAVVQDHALEAEADRLGRHAAAHRVAAQAKMPPSAAAQPSAPVRVSSPVAAGSGRYRLTAGAGNRPVGSVVVHAGDKGAVEVTDLQVSEMERGHGIGRMLLAGAARAGLRSGKSTVTLAAQDSGSGRLTRWYKEMGFAQVGVNRRGYPQLEAPISRVLAGAAAQPKMLRRGPPPLTVFGGPGLQPAAASGAAPPGIRGRAAPIRAGIVQRMEQQEPEKGSLPGLGALPAEVHHLIASHLTPKDLGRLGLTSKYFKDITHHPAVVRHVFRDYPFVLKLSMPGSKNTLWRTSDWDNSWSDERKNTPKVGQQRIVLGKEYKTLPFADIEGHEVPLALETDKGEVESQVSFYHTRKYKKKRVSVNEEIAVFTIAGPLKWLGSRDAGLNQIASASFATKDAVTALRL